MTSPLSILIIAPPSRFSDGLQAVVQTLPKVECNIRAQASEMSQKSAPAVIILDASYPICEEKVFFEDIHCQFPQAKTIILVNTAAQVQTFTTLADKVLLKGFSTAVLHKAITDLCPKHFELQIAD